MPKKPKGSHCWCDNVKMIGKILPMLTEKRGKIAPKQAIGFNCSCNIKGKKGVHTGTHITIQQRGK